MRIKNSAADLILLCATLLPIVACSAADTSSTKPATYTAPDHSASVGLPSGWKVSKAGNGVIQATGPNGESASLGVVFQVHNGPLQLNAAQLDIPNQSSLPQKLNAMVLLGQHGGTASASAAAQNTLISQAQIKVPAAMGQCGRFLFSTAQQGSSTTDTEAVFCSTPLNSSGIYNLIYVGVTVPATLATQERAALESLLASFSVPSAVAQSKLTIAAPPAARAATAAPPVALPAATQAYMQSLQAGLINEATAGNLRAAENAQLGSDFSFNCDDDLMRSDNYNYYHSGC